MIELSRFLQCIIFVAIANTMKLDANCNVSKCACEIRCNVSKCMSKVYTFSLLDFYDRRGHGHGGAGAPVCSGHENIIHINSTTRVDRCCIIFGEVQLEVLQ